MELLAYQLNRFTINCFFTDSGTFILELNEYIVHSHESKGALFFTISDVVYLLVDNAIYTFSWERGIFSLQSKNITIDGIGTEKVEFIRVSVHIFMDISHQRSIIYSYLEI